MSNIFDLKEHQAIQDLVNMSESGMSVAEFKDKYPEYVDEDYDD